MDYAVSVHELQGACKLLKTTAHPARIPIRIVGAIVRVQSLGLHDKHEVALSTGHHDAVAHVLETKIRSGATPVLSFLCGVMLGT